MQLQPPERLVADLACRPQFQMSSTYGKSIFIVLRMASDRDNYIQGYSHQVVIQARIPQEAKEVLRQGVEEVIFLSLGLDLLQAFSLNFL